MYISDILTYMYNFYTAFLKTYFIISFSDHKKKNPLFSLSKMSVCLEFWHK